jgi:hypothetical protein
VVVGGVSGGVGAGSVGGVVGRAGSVGGVVGRAGSVGGVVGRAGSVGGVVGGVGGTTSVVVSVIVPATLRPATGTVQLRHMWRPPVPAAPTGPGRGPLDLDQ